ncbi:alpha/beta hydrolase [Sulfuriferula nivalis]|uniref:Carboxylesterase n=1 Tax=Sulfuriferula nivalis TaxID=2675298 RepID=A0A809RKR8_9PROT|nr:carboxylesterase [Sulfuriferula nivalis]BBP02156.1 carboxylesterase [Sulfuriferula nivalis]
MAKQPLIILNGEAKASVILLHGLGADGHDLAPVVDMLAIPDVRFVLPHAGTRPVTINGGYVMPAWYDIQSADITQQQDDAGFEQSRLIIDGLIADEISLGIPQERIMLAGFSQGGAIALYSGLSSELPLAGIAALSSYLPTLPALKQNPPPIWMAHGKHDDIIPLAVAEASWSAAPSYMPERHTYPMGHEISMEEITDLRTWLLKTLA